MCECGTIPLPLNEKHTLNSSEKTILSDHFNRWKNNHSPVEVEIIVTLICILKILEANVVHGQQIDMLCGRATDIRNLTPHNPISSSCPVPQRQNLYLLHHLIQKMNQRNAVSQAKEMSEEKFAASVIWFRVRRDELAPIYIMYLLFVKFYEQLSKLCKKVQTKINICKNDINKTKESYNELCKDIALLQGKVTELKDVSGYRKILPEHDRL